MSQHARSYCGGPLGPPFSSLFLRLTVLCVTACLALLITACEKRDSSIIDSLGSPPYIASASITPSAINLDTIPQNLAAIQFVINAQVVSVNGNSPVAEVSYSITDATGTDDLAAGQLTYHGSASNPQAGDSIFDANVSIPTQNLSVGSYVFQILAVSAQGYTSSTLLIPVAIIRSADHPPVLSNLQAPDTIHLGNQTQEFILAVKATDPDGQSDVAKVFFDSYLPSGTAATKNPFLMYDDGSENIIIPPDYTSGDAVKGDSVYTLTVFISPTDPQGNPTALGPYRFEFQAVDRSNVYSQKLTWTIEVVP